MHPMQSLLGVLLSRVCVRQMGVHGYLSVELEHGSVVVIKICATEVPQQQLQDPSVTRVSIV